MQENRTVFLVDDDVAVRYSLSVFLKASGYDVKTFPSAEAFLEDAGRVNGIMLLDMCMTGMSGLELQAKLAKRGFDLPIIFITGHGDVRMSVQAVKAGAIDFLEKPFSNEDLLASLGEAFSHADARRKRHRQVTTSRKNYACLTAREREVIKHVVAGLTNRKLAELLSLSERTIEVHRSRAMKKMGAESLPDLVQKYAMC